jgi:hypothetical protein
MAYIDEKTERCLDSSCPHTHAAHHGPFYDASGRPIARPRKNLQDKITDVRQLILRRHKTPEGIMMPIYHDYNMWFQGHIPKMCYVTTMAPGSSKDIILHQRRTACLTAVTGNVVLFYADQDADIVRRISMNIENNDDDKGTTCATMVPPNTAISLTNMSDKTTAIIINLPSPAWRPNDEDTTKFKGWQEYFSWRSRGRK